MMNDSFHNKVIVSVCNKAINHYNTAMTLQ